MRITIFLYLLAICTIAIVTADVGSRNADVRLPVHKPEDSDDQSPADFNVLLATLLEMHQNLIAQISLLEDKLNRSSLPNMEKSEIKHMVAHYTAQKDNIESSINQIQSNDGLLMSEGRSIDEDTPSQTKSIQYIAGLFKRNRTPANTQQTNPNVAYSLSYRPSQQPPMIVYQAPQPTSQPSYESRPTYTYQPPSPPTVPPPQPHYEPQPTYVYQASPPIQPINDLQESIFPGFDAQANQNGQYYSSVDLESQNQPQIQFQYESVFKPQTLPVRRPQVPEFDSQRNQQQTQFGQKEGVFVYYPNGVITDDKNRPTIANRFGQAFDRFGQVFSNFGNRQPSNNNPIDTENEIILLQRSENSSGKNKDKMSQSKESSEQKDMQVVQKKEETTMLKPGSQMKQEKETMPS